MRSAAGILAAGGLLVFCGCGKREAPPAQPAAPAPPPVAVAPQSNAPAATERVLITRGEGMQRLQMELVELSKRAYEIEVGLRETNPAVKQAYEESLQSRRAYEAKLKESGPYAQVQQEIAVVREAYEQGLTNKAEKGREERP